MDSSSYCLELCNSSIPDNHDQAINIIYGVIAVSIVVFGLFGNLLIIITLTIDQDLKSSSNIPLGGLAISDLMVLLLIAFPSSISSFSGHCMTPGAMCYISAISSCMNIQISFSFITYITINRYVAICRPQNFRSLFSFKKTMFHLVPMVIFCSVVTPLLLILPPNDPFAFVCYSKSYVSCTFRYQYPALMQAMTLLLLVIPDAISTFCFWRMYVTLTKRMQNLQGTADSQRNQDNERLFRMLLATFIVTNICWLPTFVAVVLDPQLRAPRNVIVCTQIMLFTSSSVNPVIYAAFNPNFKEAFKRVLLKISSNRVSNGSQTTQTTQN